MVESFILIIHIHLYILIYIFLIKEIYKKPLLYLFLIFKTKI